MREVFVLMEDVDGTTWSGPEPIGFAVTSEEQARTFVQGTSGIATYKKLLVVDTVGEVREIQERQHGELQARCEKMMEDRREQEEKEFRDAIEANKNKPIPDSQFSPEEEEMIGPLLESVRKNGGM